METPMTTHLIPKSGGRDPQPPGLTPMTFLLWMYLLLASSINTSTKSRSN